MNCEDQFKQFFQNILKLCCCCCSKKKITPITIPHDSHKQTHKQNATIPIQFQYKYTRIQHLEYYIDNYTSKFDHNIPNEIIERVRQNINGKLTTPIFVRQILKRERLRKYYEYSYNISQIINYGGRDYPPLIQEYQRIEFRKMFKQIQDPYNKSIENTHRNFLPYKYVLRKFCELKRWNQIKNVIPSIKSFEKLLALDKIWKYICKELEWEFIPSISNDAFSQ